MNGQQEGGIRYVQPAAMPYLLITGRKGYTDAVIRSYGKGTFNPFRQLATAETRCPHCGELLGAHG